MSWSKMLHARSFFNFIDDFWERLSGAKDCAILFIVSHLLSISGLVKDGFGKRLRLGDRVGLLCQEHDGVGPTEDAWGSMSPCLPGNDNFRIIGMRYSPIIHWHFVVLLQTTQGHRWVHSTYVSLDRGQLFWKD